MVAARLAVVAALLLIAPARALAWPQDNPHWRWTWYDTVLQATFVAATAADCALTANGAAAPPYWNGRPRYRETNLFLPNHPTPRQIIGICSAVVIGHTALMVITPRPLREVVQVISIGIELNAVHHNFSIGLNLRF